MHPLLLLAALGGLAALAAAPSLRPRDVGLNDEDQDHRDYVDLFVAPILLPLGRATRIDVSELGAVVDTETGAIVLQGNDPVVMAQGIVPLELPIARLVADPSTGELHIFPITSDDDTPATGVDILNPNENEATA